MLYSQEQVNAQAHAVNVGTAMKDFITNYGHISHHAKLYDVLADTCRLQDDASRVPMPAFSSELVERQEKIQERWQDLIEEVEEFSKVEFVPPPN